MDIPLFSETNLIVSAEQAKLIVIAASCKTSFPLELSYDTSGSVKVAFQALLWVFSVDKFENWSQSSKWEEQLNDDFVNVSCEIRCTLIAVLLRLQSCSVKDGSFICTFFNHTGETLIFLSNVFVCLWIYRSSGCQHFLLSMQLQRHSFYTLRYRAIYLIILPALVCG